MSARCSRLLAGWHETGQPAGLDDHLRRYGTPPLPGSREARHQLIEDVTQSGLTGRGGAAFPAGRKLAAVAAARGPAVLVANGMESEPVSRKDQALLTLAPHLILDGIALAAAAVGARDVFVCLPRDRRRQAQAVQQAIELRWSRGLDQVPVTVRTLPRRYVSSEETSLVGWLNGGDARPAGVPPRPSERGVMKRPTLVSNVETLAHLALIARYGPDWFRRAGTREAPGTALVTLAGAVAQPSVQEIALGALVRDVLALGGPAEPPQAVLFGGYQGGWLPADEALGLRYTAPALQAAGAALGPGLIVVLPPGRCGLAETARILEYLAQQSAGQCGPCRLGLPAVARDFADLAWGRGSARRLEERISLLAGRGACQHPDGAARLAASALRTFAGDARRHLSSGPCAAARSAGPAAVPVPDRREAGSEEWR